MNLAGDSLDYHNKKEFTSRDNDNDHASGFNCAITHGGGAGGWWAGCGYSNMMGEYGSSGDVGYNFMSWHHFDLSENVALKSMKWMMKPAVWNFTLWFALCLFSNRWKFQKKKFKWDLIAFWLKAQYFLKYFTVTYSPSFIKFCTFSFFKYFLLLCFFCK